MVSDLDRWATNEAARQRIPFAWPGLYIVSGYRTSTAQAFLNPNAPDSLHVRCPALAIDLRVGNIPGLEAGVIWAWLGARWKMVGGRWGGNFIWQGSPLPNPSEWNHFDLGVGVVDATPLPLTRPRSKVTWTGPKRFEARMQRLRDLEGGEEE